MSSTTLLGFTLQDVKHSNTSFSRTSENCFMISPLGFQQNVPKYWIFLNEVKLFSITTDLCIIFAHGCEGFGKHFSEGSGDFGAIVSLCDLNSCNRYSAIRSLVSVRTLLYSSINSAQLRQINGAELIEEYRRVLTETRERIAEYLLQEFKSHNETIAPKSPEPSEKCLPKPSQPWAKIIQRSVVIENNFPSFKNIQYLGTFCWNNKGEIIKQFSDVREKDVLECLTSWSVKPSKVVEDMSSLAPMTFEDLPPNRHQPFFPYDSSHDDSLILSLYGSKKYFGLSTEKIDLLFGGSVLGVLANKHI
jgi:hypothetical protein